MPRKKLDRLMVKVEALAVEGDYTEDTFAGKYADVSVDLFREIVMEINKIKLLSSF